MRVQAAVVSMLLLLCACGDDGRGEQEEDSDTNDANTDRDAGSTGSEDAGAAQTAVPGTATYSCDHRPRRASCQEYVSRPVTVPTHKEVCDNSNSTWAEGGCERAGSLGGCRQGSSTYPTTTWHYPTPTSTAAAFKAECESPKWAGTYVEP